MQPNKRKKSHKLPMMLTPALLSIGFLAILLILGYFHLILVPKLHEQNQSHAQVFANSISSQLMYKKNLQDTVTLQRELSKLLLYNDPNYAEPFILGLQLELNPDIFSRTTHVVNYGLEECQRCFTSEVILTDSANAEILGSVKYLINPKGHSVFLEEITGKFYVSIIIATLILFLVGITMNQLFSRVLETQNKIIRTNKHSQLILNSMLDIVLLINEDGRIIDSNPAAQKLLKFTQEELTNIYIYSLVKTNPPVNNVLHRVTTLDDQGIEIQYSPKNSDPRFGVLHSSKFITESQEERFLLVIKDIHDLRLAQDKIQFQADLSHSSRLKSLGEMASGIAHEINQPLAIIRLGVEGIQQIIEETNPEALEISIADDVLEQVHRASNIINNMRSFARYESSPKSWIDPCTPVLNSIKFLKDQLRVRNITLKDDLARNCPRILLEQQKAEQILINLIINARHSLEKVADSREKQILIKLTCDDEKAILTVTDNGEGMSQETLDRCLEPFFTTKATSEGTGLGLAIVKSILDEFDADISIDSELGKGTTFTLSVHHEKSPINLGKQYELPPSS